VGGLGVGQVGRRDFAYQLTDRVRASGEAVGDGAQHGERGIRRRIGGRHRGGADVADGLADHRAHDGLIEGLEAAVGEHGESAGDQLRSRRPTVLHTPVRRRLRAHPRSVR
jgi:hypothetical protein